MNAERRRAICRMATRHVRIAVATRDVGCLAPRLDPGCGPCRDRWGSAMDNAPRFLSLDDGEMDYVRRESVGPRHVLACDHCWLCPGHHRGTGSSSGYVWATAHRELLAGYLAPLREPS